jgi:hypothetical protein
MTGTQTLPMPGRDNVQLLVEDLACASGTLSEIATTGVPGMTWRACPWLFHCDFRTPHANLRHTPGHSPGQALAKHPGGRPSWRDRSLHSAKMPPARGP